MSSNNFNVTKMNLQDLNVLLGILVQERLGKKSKEKWVYFKSNNLEVLTKEQGKSGEYRKYELSELIQICKKILEESNRPNVNEFKLIKKQITQLSRAKAPTALDKLSDSVRIFLLQIYQVIGVSGTEKSQRSQEIKAFLSKVEILTHSSHGSRGVYILSSSQMDSLVVKILGSGSSSETPELQEALLREFNFATPRSVTFFKKRAMSQEILKCLRTHAQKVTAFDSKARQSQSEKKRKRESSNRETGQVSELKEQIKINPGIICMDFLQGEVLADVKLDDLVDMFNDQNFMRSIGKVLFFDLLCGNEDRLVNSNRGNILVRKEMTASNSVKYLLELVDNDVVLNQVDPNFIVKLIQIARKGGNTASQEDFFLKVVSGIRGAPKRSQRLRRSKVQYSISKNATDSSKKFKPDTEVALEVAKGFSSMSKWFFERFPNRQVLEIFLKQVEITQQQKKDFANMVSVLQEALNKIEDN